MIKTCKQERVFCPHPWNRIKVDPEGFATMCCFHERQCLGNILEDGLDAIWNSQLSNDIRDITLKNELHATCKASTCPYIHVEDNLPNQKNFSVLVPLEDGPAPLPKQLELDLPTQWCNIGGLKPTKKNPACIMCERHVNFQPQEDRLKEVCQILKEHTFDAVHIQGVAEPFWKDRIFEIIEDLGLWDRPNTLVTTTTNGTILTEKKIEHFLKLPNSGITFSIDASTPETYKRIRRIDAYDLIIKNLMAYSKLRSPQQALYIHNNINLINVGEVVGMVKVAAEAKVNHVEFNPTYSTPGICVSKSNVHIFKKAEIQILEAVKELDVHLLFMRKLTLDFMRDEDLVQIT